MKPDEIAKLIPDEVVEAAAFYLPGYYSKDIHNYVRAALAAGLWSNE